MFKELKDLATKIMGLSPCIYTFFNYFFIIEKEQRWLPMGWALLIVSVAYFFIALYGIVKNGK